MSDLRDLYQEVILDHNRRPRNCRRMSEPTHTCEGINPLCGDRITVFVSVAGDRIADVSFEGSGCAISRASASLMTDAVKGKTLAEADALFSRFHDLVATDAEPPDAETLGKLSVFAGVRDYPSRVKCATLSWHALRTAVAGAGAQVSTE